MSGFEDDFDAGSFFSGSGFLFFGALAFFGVPLIAFIGKKVNYSRAEYRFFDDHMELEEGFFSVNRKQVRYADIKEITLHQGMLQRTVGLGTVYLATMATGSSPGSNAIQAFGFGNVSASGASIRDIPNPDEAYERIRRIVKPHAA